MQSNSLGISITNKCNSKCKMCCFSCNYENNDVVNLEYIKSLLDQAKNIKSIKKVSFTGGEPFLYFDLLLESVKYAVEKGFEAGTISNGFWAKNKSYGMNLIGKLVKAGIKRIALSYDEFHEEYIDHDTICNAIDICTNYNIRCEVNLGFIKTGKKPSYFVDILGNRILNLPVIFQPILPVGEALKHYTKSDFIYKKKKYNLTCPNLSMGVRYVNIKGDIYPCCSQVIEDTFLLSGNILKENLQQINRNILGNPFLYILYKKGFDFYINIMENELNMNIEDSWCGPCHLCHFIFSNSDLITKLKPFVYKEIKQELQYEPAQVL